METTDTTTTRLKLQESKVSEPIIVPTELIKKYINETPVLINGIITYIIKTSKENFYDSEAIKLGIEKCINHLLLDKITNKITKYRVAVDGIHIIEAEILPGTPDTNFIFNYIKVTPEYDKDNEETCFFEEMI